jgi:DNA-directed RNA polymerase subunit M/transcription elongation factor TFIIS
MTTKKSNIILPNDYKKQSIENEIIKIGKKLMHEAIKEAKRVKKCKKCGSEKHLKLVPLHELPFPLPTKIVLYCAKCKHNEVLMAQESSKMMQHFTDLMQKAIRKTTDGDKVIKDDGLADKLIKKK